MRGRRSRGIEAEVLASLAVVMGIATGLLALGLLEAHQDQLQRVRDFVGRGLLEETRGAAFGFGENAEGIDWWIVSPATGNSRAVGAVGIGISAREMDLAREASAAGAVVEAGAPWQAIRFATPLGPGAFGAKPGEVAVARIAPAVSLLSLTSLLIVDSAIFSLLGVYLLRRRVVEPLRRLEEATRSLSDGRHARVAVEGVAEVASLAANFNDMSEALERRTGSLEKAISDLRGANAQLREARAGLERSERLAAVGSLAAGVAHEIGNPMGAILAFLDLAQRDRALSDETRSHVARAAEQGERVREILRRLLDFSRPPRAERVAVDLRSCVDQVVDLVAAQRPYRDVTIEVRAPSSLPPVVADPGLVAQILLNIVINAADAAAPGGAPHIEIDLAPHWRTARAADPPGAVPERPPDAVSCSIRDNGPGVPREHRSRVFDPFFTTKDPGQGTGLGLANVARLLEELGGSVELLDQDACPGACFRITLPTTGSGGASASGRSREGEAESGI